jgi:MinD-like ATPase involved in chromosome partitioning or flagellar assembly
MATIVSIHSFRGGTGKSNSTANLAALLAADGRRVGVVDTDILSPGIHVLFGLAAGDAVHTLNDHLWGRCEITEVALNVTARLGPRARGEVFLIPASIKPGEIARILREGYDVGLLNDGLRQLIAELHLDVLLIDTHPGLNEETLLSVAISDCVVLLMRPDAQDYQGTAVTVDVARKLDVPRLLLLVNKVPAALDPAELRAQIERAYGCEVVGIVPHSEEMLLLGSSDIFVLRYPDHPTTAIYRRVAERVMAQ